MDRNLWSMFGVKFAINIYMSILGYIYNNIRRRLHLPGDQGGSGAALARAHSSQQDQDHPRLRKTAVGLCGWGQPWEVRCPYCGAASYG